MQKPAAPKGHNTINSFIITKDAPKLIKFLEAVFGAKEDKDAHTMDDDGLLLHSDLQIGDSVVMVLDSKPGWPHTPSLLQVYVDNVDTTLARAKKHGAKVVTKPTEFYGDIFSRFIDPFGNLWWVYKHNQQADANWQEDTTGGGESWEPTEEMRYIHDTLLEAMKSLNKR